MKASYLSKLLDLIAPRQCALCGRRLAPTESVVCAPCQLAMPTTGYVAHAADNPMARLFWGQLTVERAAALMFYHRKTDVALMIHDMKYHQQPGLARRMGAYAARQFQREGFFEGIDVLVPIPLTRRRQWQRGYNQSLEICRGIAEVTGIPVDRKAVRRVAFSGSQTQMTVQERRENVEAVFRLSPHADVLRGRHVLLVDDVVTTGSTMTACGRQLCQVEGLRLSLLSLAVVQPSRLA